MIPVTRANILPGSGTAVIDESALAWMVWPREDVNVAAKELSKTEVVLVAAMY